MINCNKCGKPIQKIEADVFDHEGADFWELFPINPYKNTAVYVDLPTSWTGCDLSEDEARECIRCPHCKEYPFDDQEIHVHMLASVVMFDKRNHPGESDISVEWIKQQIKAHPGMHAASWGRLLSMWEEEEGKEIYAEND